MPRVWRVFRNLALTVGIAQAICAGLYGRDLAQPTPGPLMRPFYPWITPTWIVFALLLPLSVPCAPGITLFTLVEALFARRWPWLALPPTIAVGGIVLAMWANINSSPSPGARAVLQEVSDPELGGDADTVGHLVAMD